MKRNLILLMFIINLLISSCKKDDQPTDTNSIIIGNTIGMLVVPYNISIDSFPEGYYDGASLILDVNKDGTSDFNIKFLDGIGRGPGARNPFYNNQVLYPLNGAMIHGVMQTDTVFSNSKFVHDTLRYLPVPIVYWQRYSFNRIDSTFKIERILDPALSVVFEPIHKQLYESDYLSSNQSIIKCFDLTSYGINDPVRLNADTVYVSKIERIQYGRKEPTPLNEDLYIGIKITPKANGPSFMGWIKIRYVKNKMVLLETAIQH